MRPITLFSIALLSHALPFWATSDSLEGTHNSDAEKELRRVARDERWVQWRKVRVGGLGKQPPQHRGPGDAASTAVLPNEQVLSRPGLRPEWRRRVFNATLEQKRVAKRLRRKDLAVGGAGARVEKRGGSLPAPLREHGPNIAPVEHVKPKDYPGLFISSYNKVVNYSAGAPSVGGRILLIDAPSGRNVLVCLPEKTGSSRWKMLIFKSMGVHTNNVHDFTPPWLKRLTREEKLTRSTDPFRSRLMFVRNPYVRLLSSFLDKAVHPVGLLDPNNTQWPKSSSILSHGGPYRDAPQEFARFVSTMVKMTKSGRQINGHFAPLSKRCGIHAGLQYDFFLKVEEMDLWYADVVTLMGLAPYAEDGWEQNKGNNVTANHADDSSCFYKLSGLSCAETGAAIKKHADKGSRSQMISLPIAAATPEWTTALNTPHARGADARMHTYYNSPDVIANATEYLKQDLVLFGYKEMEPGGGNQ